MSQENVEVVRRMLTSRQDYEAAFAETRTDLVWVVAKEHPNVSNAPWRSRKSVATSVEWNEMLEDIQFDVDRLPRGP